MDWAQIFESTARAAVGRTAIIYAIAAVGLNLHFGYTGLLNFGQVGFMAVSAYFVAIAVNAWGLPLLAGAGIGLLAAMVLALLLGLPTLRLRADYLAIVTIAAGEIFRTAVRAPSWRSTTGGANGISDFSDAFFDVNPIPSGRYGFGPWEYSARDLWILSVGWGTVLFFTLVVYLLMRSPWGRVIKAIREDEDASRSLGKNAYGYKMQSLVIGGVIGGAAGIFWAVAQNSVIPGNFRPETTFYIYVALILGGTAKTWGPVVGSMILWGVLEFTDGVLGQATDEGYISKSIMDGPQIGQVRFILVGIALVLLIIFRPQGIFGDRREIALEL